VAGVAGVAAYGISEIVTQSGNPKEAALRVANVVIVAGVTAWLIDRAHHVALTCFTLSLVAVTIVFLGPASADETTHIYELRTLFYGSGWLFLAAIVTGIGRWYGPRDGT
jgi:hypothetical protein